MIMLYCWTFQLKEIKATNGSKQKKLKHGHGRYCMLYYGYATRSVNVNELLAFYFDGLAGQADSAWGKQTSSA
jgi:hypothetical protein